MPLDGFEPAANWSEVEHATSGILAHQQWGHIKAICTLCQYQNS